MMVVCSFLHLFIQMYFEQYVPGLVFGTRNRMNTTKSHSLAASLSVLKGTEFLYMEESKTKGLYRYKGD